MRTIERARAGSKLKVINPTAYNLTPTEYIQLAEIESNPSSELCLLFPPDPATYRERGLLFEFDQPREPQIKRTFALTRSRDKGTGFEMYRAFWVVGNRFNSPQSQSVLALDEMGNPYEVYPSLKRTMTDGKIAYPEWIRIYANDAPGVGKVDLVTVFPPPIGSEALLVQSLLPEELSLDQNAFFPHFIEQLRSSQQQNTLVG